jgi:V/A-type H+-transporting ATPase subunit C
MDNIGTYAYAVGRVKALEARLLDTSGMQRMIDAPNFDEAMRYLADSEYSGKLQKGGFEEALNSTVRQVYETIASFSPDPYFTGMFFAEYDFMRLKAFLKAAFMKAAGLPAVMGEAPELGFITVRELSDIAAAAASSAGDGREGREVSLTGAEGKKLGDAEELKLALLKAASEASARYARSEEDPLEIDSAVDSAYFAYIAKMASSRSAKWAEAIVAAKADMANTLLVMRAAAAGKDAGFVKASLVSGGRIVAGSFVEASKEGEARLRRALEASPYWRSIGAAFEHWAKEGSLRPFEMAADAYVFGLAREAKSMSDGYAPVMGYLLMKQQEASIIRRILAGKAKALAPSFIRERMSDGNA